VLRYQTVQWWLGGFVARITIDFHGRPPAHWRLRFSYPSARVYRVTAGSVSAKLTPSGQNGGVVTPTNGAARTAVISYGVSANQTGPPAHCSFDGMACHIH
jgi:hypothetical protein